jgi:hypothetical protein
MSLGKRKKKNTTITFSRLDGADFPPTSKTVEPDGTTVLREKTTIRQDGRIRQERTMVTVSLDSEWSTPKVHPDVPRPPEPIYESYSAADHGGEDDFDDDEGGRDLRASVSHTILMCEMKSYITCSGRSPSPMDRGPPRELPG